ncbi:hypothetical protein KJR58_24290, partial [Escherichia coli]|uniref:hypothetical protein n=1 Tax=Escherichia coli TaxID=562 RepID=UPI0020033714
FFFFNVVFFLYYVCSLPSCLTVCTLWGKNSQETRGVGVGKGVREREKRKRDRGNITYREM